MISKCYYNDMKTRTYIFVFRDIVKDTDYRVSFNISDLRNAFDFIEAILFDKDLRLVNAYYVLSGPKLRRFRFKGLALNFFRPLDVLPNPSFELLSSRPNFLPDDCWT